jgi:cytidine deaminase
MKEIIQQTKLTVLSFSELNPIEKDLKNASFQARLSAYAPYSKFQVGVAILLENGMIIKGSNQENAAYPSGLCAERVAIFYAGANYPDQKIKKIFISAAPENKELNVPIPPCGSCRQSIAEYETNQNEDIEIYFMGNVGDIYKSDSLKNLLPYMFTKHNL